MADVKIVDEGGEFPEKRTLDPPNSINKALDDSSKRQKIEVPTGKNGSVPLVAGDAAKSEEHVNAVAAAAEEDEDDDEDEEDYTAEQDEDADEDANGEASRKGKGVVVDRKGKGKMIEDSDNDDSDGRVDDDDDSSDDSDSDFSDGLDESDLEDDPLAEVDLDNILPSRTRRSRAQPGVRFSNDPGKGKEGCYCSSCYEMNQGQGWTTFLDLFLQFMLDAAFKWKDPGCFLCLASRAIDSSTI